MPSKDKDLDSVRVQNWEALLPVHSHQQPPTVTAGGGAGVPPPTSSSNSSSCFFMFSRMVPDNNSRYAQLLSAKEEPNPENEGGVTPGDAGQLPRRAPGSASAKTDAPANPKTLRKALEAAISEATLDFVLIHAPDGVSRIGADADQGTTPARADSSPAIMQQAATPSRGTAKSGGGNSSTKKTGGNSSGNDSSSGVKPGFHAVSLWRATTTVKELKPECLDWITYWRLLEDVFRWGRSDRAVLSIFPTPINPTTNKVCRLEVRLLSRHSTASVMAAVLHCSLLNTSIANTLQLVSVGGGSEGDGGEDEVTIVGSTTAVATMVSPHSFLLSSLSAIIRRLSADTQNKAEVLHLLADSKLDYEAVLEDKVNSEEELLSAFVEVLNTKKEKIRDLTVLAQQQQERIAELEAALAAGGGAGVPSVGAIVDIEEEEDGGSLNGADEEKNAGEGTSALEVVARHSQAVSERRMFRLSQGGEAGGVVAGGGLGDASSTQFQAAQESNANLLLGQNNSSYGNLYMDANTSAFGQQQLAVTDSVSPQRQQRDSFAGGGGGSNNDGFLDPQQVGRAAGGGGAAPNDALGKGRTKRLRDDEAKSAERRKSAASGADLLNLDI